MQTFNKVVHTLNMSRIRILIVLFVHLLILLEDDICKAQQLDNRIVGGHKAGIKHFKSVVSLRKGPNRKHCCGGTILGPTLVLTAAHCVFEQPLTSISYGSSHITDDTTRQIIINSSLLHEEYNPKHQTHDIALLFLQNAINFSQDVQPINLTALSKQHQDVQVVGWGVKREEGKGSKVLRFLEMETISDEECAKSLSDELKAALGNDHVCTRAKKGTGDCFGDSGGPLVNTDGDQGGIVSWGSSGCANDRPNVYIDVSKYIKWINKNGGLNLKLKKNRYEEYEARSKVDEFFLAHFGNRL